MMKNLDEVINRAIAIKELNGFSFVTVWKTEDLFGFNFDNKPVGYITKEYGVNRIVVGVY